MISKRDGVELGQADDDFLIKSNFAVPNVLIIESMPIEVYRFVEKTNMLRLLK